MPIALTQVPEKDLNLTIDGRLDEEIWKNLESRDGMVVIRPDTLEQTDLQTKKMMFYTERGLYVGAWNEQPEETQVVRLSARDKFLSRDRFGITIDPSGEGLYGYWFTINLGDTLNDGTVLPERQFSNRWDGPWKGATAQGEGGWSAEMFLPWSMMSMPESDGNVRQMGYYVNRYLSQRNEQWAYPALPPTRPVFLSALQPFTVEDINPKQQFTFYPFASTTYDRTESENGYKAGFDIFWRPSTNLQLTATVNPDFGNVESDNVVVNLSAFETFFPEKRAFFLEGNEIFVATPRARRRRNSNQPPTTLVNTRRIGGPPHSVGITGFELSDIEKNQPSELLGAAKVTGQNGRFRYGFLGAFEDDTLLRGELNGLPYDVEQDGRDFGIARVLYEETSGGGRRSLGWMSTMVAHPQEDALAHGLDFHLLTEDGSWSLDGQLLMSDVDDVEGVGGFVDLSYSPRRGITHDFKLDYFDDQINLNDLGFLRRNDIMGGSYELELRSPGSGLFKEVTRNMNLVRMYNSNSQRVMGVYNFEQDLVLRNNHSIYTRLRYIPSRWDDITSDDNGAFPIQGRLNTGIFFETDESRPLSLGFGVFAEQEPIDGLIHEYEIEANWRPSDRFSLALELEYEKRDGWLIHKTGRDFTTFEAEFWRPEVEADFFLSARQQFRVTMQWAGLKAFENARWQVPVQDGALMTDTRVATSSRDFSVSRLTFQARYRWEIAPLSDLFVVYTRGSNIERGVGEGFERSFRDALTQPAVDTFVVKLRYRLGS